MIPIIVLVAIMLIIAIAMRVEISIVPRGTSAYKHYIPRIPMNDPLKAAKKINDIILIQDPVTIVNGNAVKLTPELAKKGHNVRGICIETAPQGTRIVKIANSGGISEVKKSNVK